MKNKKLSKMTEPYGLIRLQEFDDHQLNSFEYDKNPKSKQKNYYTRGVISFKND